MTTASDLDDPALYFSQEVSWLKFNERVLAEAADPGNPLLERLKFLAIFSNNLDEFFMVRVAGLKQQIEAEVTRRSVDGKLPLEQLDAVSAYLRPLLERHYGLLNGEILPALAELHDIRLIPYRELEDTEKTQLRMIFIDRVFPVLTPLAVDRSHPFPYISNLSLSLAVEIEDRIAAPGRRAFARVKVPNSLPRFFPLQNRPPNHYVLFEELIAGNLDLLFPGMQLLSAWAFRATRDADLDLQEDEADDLLGAIESELRRRRFGEPVRLEVAKGMPPEMRERLLEALELEPIDCYEIDGPLAVSDFWALVNLDLPAAHDPPYTPSIPERLSREPDIFAVIRSGDVLLHHPYESFDPVVHFIRQAANDPKVFAIKQTLYRASGKTSPILAALVEAAENGKQVAVVIEVKARFDEEKNIELARRLEHVGAHVVYSLPALKTHAKIALVVREEDEGLRRYVHVGSGNYNERTARVYTDISLFSCRPDLGHDATQLFNAMTGYARQGGYQRFLVAPHELRSAFLRLIEREEAHALAGRPSGIVAKINALSDPEIIRALYRASSAGVEIDLVVRGICVLRPGVPGVSERIRVRSVIGRFLEHSRIFIFVNGGERECYFGSADWMTRNLDRRVELVVPVRDQPAAERIDGDIMTTLLRDTAGAWRLGSDGDYTALAGAAAEPFCAQADFLARTAGSA